MDNATFIQKAHARIDIDVDNAARGVWLVKVPKYISDKWNSLTETQEVGKLVVTKTGGVAKPDVRFTLDDRLAEPTTETEVCLPKEHNFSLCNAGSQGFSILAQQASANADLSPLGMPILDMASIEGKVVQRAECQPIQNDINYMKYKKLHVEQVNKPQKEMKQLKKVVLSYKPVAAHSFHIQQEARRKEDSKRARADKDKVMDMLFSAFEKHQYYNVKDLQAYTQQPITYLKDILREICNYNMKAPHRSMWELKPEFRHYKQENPPDT